jgi:hypothetical protein
LGFGHDAMTEGGGCTPPGMVLQLN